MRISPWPLMGALIFFVIPSVCAQTKEEKLSDQLKPAIFALTRVMMHDVVSPTIASRYYMYATIGGYAILAQEDPSLVHPSKFIRHFSDTLGGSGPSADAALASLFCIYETGMLMLPSGLDISKEYDDYRDRCIRMGYGKKAVAAARARAAAVASAIVAYSRDDHYRFLSSFPRYRPSKKPGYWFPTPPGYMDAADPHWAKMRPLVLDSAGQFRCPKPVAYDTAKGSDFRRLTDEVYMVSGTLDPEQREIAGFWDCNPFVVASSGHMTLGFKKISPGGHWMNIACIAAEQRKIPYRQRMQLLALEAITLYDAFIACWNEKFATDRVRPESVINAVIDLRWQPLLQTPPFPEYTSGHSVISSASAEMLSYLLGEDLAYTDDTEVIFELSPRRFPSLRAAAAEAGISRLYGGIHFRDAIEAGQEQGARVGRHIVRRVAAAGVSPYLQRKP